MAINKTAGNDTTVGDSIVGGAEYDRLYINQFSSATPFTHNYTNASNTTFNGGLLKEVEYIDFREGTGNDNINTSVATSSTLSGGTGNDALITGTGNVIT